VEGSVIASVAGSGAAWYLALALFGLAGLVPTALLFDRLASRGVFLARPLGLGLAALVTWLVVYLTPATYGTPATIASVLALLGVSAALAAWRREVVPALRARWRSIAVAEVLTLVVFVLVLWARVMSPDAWGTEKPADLMLLNAVHNAREFPPLDPWLAGARISYYHLGHLQVDHVARLSGEPPANAFNLATATAGALAASAIVGLAVDIVRLGGPQRRRVLVIAGGAALAGLLLVSPIVGLVQILASNGIGGDVPWGWLGVKDIPARPDASFMVPEQFWWWWPTTRVVPGVISEYPGFSLVLGDPHPHLLALPLGLAAVALAVQVFEGSTPLAWRRWFVRPDQLVLTSALFATLVMTNAWDVITYGALWALAAWWSAIRTGWPALLAGFIAVRWAMVPAVLGLAIAWPFLDTLEPQALGLAPVVGEHSDPGRWLLFWLPILVPVALGTAILWRPGRQRVLDAATYALIPVGIWIAWLLWRGDASEVLDRASGWVTLAALVAAVGWVGASMAAEPLGRRGEGAALFLVTAALGVLLLTELIHIDDSFSGRLNTAFKFWFHAWALLAAGGAALLALGSERLIEVARGNLGRGSGVQRVGRGLGWAAVAVVAGTMLTSPMAAVARAREGQEHGLSAIGYLERVDVGFHNVVRWARSELDPQEAVLAEAITESYDQGNRVAAFTGVPSVLGWPGHERQWHGRINEDARRNAIDAIYSGTRQQAIEAIYQWGVTHVVVSEQERAQYGMRVSSKFAGWPIVFSTPTVQVFLTPYSPDDLEVDLVEDPVTGRAE